MLGQDLKQFPFWNYFLVVCCEEFAVAVNPCPSSYHLLFHFGNKMWRGIEVLEGITEG